MNRDDLIPEGFGREFSVTAILTLFLGNEPFPIYYVWTPSTGVSVVVYEDETNRWFFWGYCEDWADGLMQVITYEKELKNAT